MADLILQQLSKVYPGGVRAVCDLSLEVGDGELVVLVGPSGCGKTTTLRMVAGLETPSSGSVAIGGRAVDSLAPNERNLAMVFQHDALYPQMTVYQNISFGLRMRKVARAEIDVRVRRAAEMLGLDKLLQRRPEALSGGERRRVALGRAVVRKPAIFLFDEPLAGLDARLRDQMRIELAELHRRLGATILYVTHDQLEAMTLGDRVAVMRHGGLQQVSTPKTLYREPANRFVAGFLGSPPMSFFAGRITRRANSTVFLGREGFELPLPDAEAKRPWVESHLDRDLTLGIRPEHVASAAASAAPLLARIAARVEMIETLGADTYVHFKTGATPFVGRPEDPGRFRLGQETLVAVDMASAQFFDGGTEARIV